MRALVIGCGLMGVTTAYFLRKRGFQVTVVDRADGPGQETSFANGALLHTSLVDPWNSPGVVWEFIRSLTGDDAALRLRARALPAMMSWGISFVLNSTHRRFRSATLRNAALAAYSKRVMEELRSTTSIQYGQWTPGTLLVFRTRSDLLHAQRTAETLRERGVRSMQYDASRLAELEPALAPVIPQLAGGIHYLDDEGGDAAAFCRELAHVASCDGVVFRFATEVEELCTRGDRVHTVRCRDEEFEADVFVMAAGSHSRRLAAPIGVGLPIHPVKGYSVTLDRDDSIAAPRIPVIDHALHGAVVPVGHRLRVAGTAEFAGYDLSVPRQRIENLIALLLRLFPGYVEHVRQTELRPWAGLRPVSVDGVPLIGRAGFSNLYFNTGHGHLGWTLAAGSAKLLADVMAGSSPEIAVEGYRPDRF